MSLTETLTIIFDGNIEDSLTFKKAMEDMDKDEWIKGCKWIYKRKRGADVKVQTFKTRLVAKSYTEVERVDYEETFSPVAMLKIINNSVDFLVMYVDDILLTGNDVGLQTDIKQWLAAQFQMKDLGEAQFVLGIQIFRDRKNKTLTLSQALNIDKIVVKYSMQNSKRGLLPLRHGVTLSKEQCPKTPQEVKEMRHIPYASVVGSLMYEMLCTRLDICYAVGIISRYQSNPGLAHSTVVKSILKDSRKSTSGSVFTLKGGVVVWRSVKQGCIDDSTIEAEYVTACEAAKEVVWLRNS
ncbi:gag/pol protein [Cucumis melo var. makuwa]|uniref:Gag/pol protein n=1 Tax=Cucumis melo var. makuwa TaxID=1194695 RepID=A0A5A7U044_CUCMM|nr:gag/pol protein [Cucumis melo var. makuwa]TYK04812.1 gag/pol protein [Cucumis melo var. makuwa]